MTRRISKKQQQHIAKQRIDSLFTFAQQQIKQDNLAYAKNAIRIARKIAMKTNLPLPKKYKINICKHCHQYLYPGITSRVRNHNGKRTITCLHCHKYNRYPYKPKKKPAVILK